MSTASTVEPAGLVPFLDDGTSRPAAELPIRDLWHWRANRTPQRPWLHFEDRVWTYEAFDVEARSLAAGLRSVGVGPGVRVLVGLGNRPETLMVHLALYELGAVCVPLVQGMGLSEYAFPINHSEATVLVAEDPIASMVLERRDDFPQLRVVVTLGEVSAPSRGRVERFEDLSTAAPLQHEPLADHDVHTLAQIAYTSGSTGRPKGVMLRAGCWYHAGLGYTELYRITGDDNYFHPLTLAHALGTITAPAVSVLTGGRLTLADRFSPKRFWGNVERHGGTVTVLFPAQLNLLLEVDDGTPAAGESSLRLVITHGDQPRFRERFGVTIATVWGMTETAGINVGSDPGYRGELDPGYVGRPYPGAEVGIFDSESFTRLPAGRPGELCIRHPQVMLGYLKDPEATAQTLVDGWVRSGDQGVVDHCGRAYFVGRYKAMIKRSGENISAEEVENAIRAHADVAECVVFGVPDRLRTEEVAAIVVRRGGARAEPSELREACAAQMVRWKLPRYILVRDEPLPVLANGKLDRVKVTGDFAPETAWDAETESG